MCVAENQATASSGNAIPPKASTGRRGKPSTDLGSGGSPPSRVTALSARKYRGRGLIDRVC